MSEKAKKISTRLAVVVGMASAVMLAAAPASQAAQYNLGSFSGSKGWDSFRWTDESYSEVYFDYCQSNEGAPDKSIEVELRRDNTAWPDNSWGTKTFTKCFSSFGSRGEWTGIGYGDTFFKIGDIDGGRAHGFTVYGSSYVDTTQAD